MLNRFQLLVALVFIAVAPAARAQTFSVDAYRDYLERNANLTPDGLEAQHPIGAFLSTAGTNFDDALYADSIDHYYKLTSYERELISRNGFMVTERQQWRSMGESLLEIYGRDLPVFITTDAILHAVHMSYDRILRDLEQRELVPRLRALLDGLQAQIGPLTRAYEGNSQVATSIADLDVYLTVSRALIGGSSTPAIAHNAVTVNRVLALIDEGGPAQVALFGESERLIDFSQFTPRGHYTITPELQKYFRTMIWLGRTELYLTKPLAMVPAISDADVQRQTIMSALLCEALAASGMDTTYAAIERTIAAFVGEQDNATVTQMAELMREAGATPSTLTDESQWRALQSLLLSKSYSKQRILSQMLVRDPSAPPLEPAAALMLFGQRFIIDSYVLGGVVYDKVESKRMLPSSQDVLFALGNNASAHLLRPDLERHGYAPQLGALRFLVDGYDNKDWQSSIYASWLDGIRALNPPADRTHLPRFMQTAAYWQQKMNTQLSSWAQLRHDNLLYAKQSYTGMPGCSFPEGMVEPIPEFYRALGALAIRADAAMRDAGINDEYTRTYFRRMREIAGVLESIARKELSNEALSADEQTFIRTMLFKSMKGCVAVPDGWYADLYYDMEKEDVVKEDYVVADVHTSPADEEGGLVGWVMHVGTGAIDMAVATCTLPDGRPIAFVGPVMSYHERVTSNFDRLTDERWQEERKSVETSRPAWVNLYLAGRDGGPRGEATHLRYATAGVDAPRVADALGVTVRPNPVTHFARISFSVPPSLAHRRFDVTIFDNSGALVRTLQAGELPGGAFELEWNMRDNDGAQVASGLYHYTVTAGDVSAAGTIPYVRDR